MKKHMSETLWWLLVLTNVVAVVVECKIIDVRSLGGIAGDASVDVSVANTKALNKAFSVAQSGDIVLVPKLGENPRARDTSFWFMGGIVGRNMVNVTFSVAGTMVISNNMTAWPLGGSSYMNVMTFENCTQFTMSGGGLIDGQGLEWWMKDILGLLKHGRPRMLLIHQSSHVTLTHLRLENSPSWHVEASDCAHVEIAYLDIFVDQKKFNSSIVVGDHLQPQDLNTDGIDPSGTDFWIHDCTIVNDDDSIAVKPCSRGCKSSDCSQNMLIERMNMSGFGASIGSVPPSSQVNCVRNITFRDIYMPQSGKGIYIKSNPQCEPGSTGIIENILYENVTILEPRWWSIWIGPQQQHEPGSELGRKCALDYPLNEHCPTQGCVSFSNIVLRDVYVHAPWLSPGVLLGNATNPMTNILFDNVVIDDPGILPFDRQYKCDSVVNSRAIHGTRPVPPCFSS